MSMKRHLLREELKVKRKNITCCHGLLHSQGNPLDTKVTSNSKSLHELKKHRDLEPDILVHMNDKHVLFLHQTHHYTRQNFRRLSILNKTRIS